MFRDELQDVARRGKSTTNPTSVDWQRAVVVKKEEPCSLPVLKPHPLHGTLAEETLLILSHMGLPTVEELPSALPVSHAESFETLESLVLFQQASIVQDSLGILAFLETHEIIWPRFASGGNELPSATIVSLPPIEKVPPPQVVCQHLDKDLFPRGIRPPQLVWMKMAFTPERYFFCRCRAFVCLDARL